MQYLRVINAFFGNGKKNYQTTMNSMYVDVICRNHNFLFDDKQII